LIAEVVFSAVRGNECIFVQAIGFADQGGTDHASVAGNKELLHVQEKMRWVMAGKGNLKNFAWMDILGFELGVGERASRQQ